MKRLCRREKLFKNGPSKICERQPLKNFTWSIFEYFVPDVHNSEGEIDKRNPQDWTTFSRILLQLTLISQNATRKNYEIL